MLTIKEEWKDFRSYLHDNIGYICVSAIVVAAVYGIRAFRDGFCIDSEIMISQPDYMKNIWLGSNRFGMYAINEIFGLERLSPYISGFLMMVTMWATVVVLGYACRIWSGKSENCRAFTRLFPLLAVTSPLFAEQYLFVLQAFEISMGLLLTVISAYCADSFARASDGYNGIQQDEHIRVIDTAKITDSDTEYNGTSDSENYSKTAKLSRFSALWGGISKNYAARNGKYAYLLAGIICAVTAFGTYQTFVPLYIALVLISFILGYFDSRSKHSIKHCFCHAAIFIMSIAVYIGVSCLVRYLTHSESAYIAGMFRWKADGTAAALLAIKTVMKQCALGQGPFFQEWFAPSAGLFVLQSMIVGWRNKQGFIDYLIFLASLAALLLTPFALVILTGGIQAARTELVYPFVAAFTLTHLCVLPTKKPKLIRAAMCAVCLYCLTRQGNTTIQMFQTAYEAYRNDVIIASQMYPELVKAAGDEELQECELTFIGSRRTSLQGPAVFGELCGRSLFDAEPSSRNGATNRLVPFFGILGMNMRILQDTETDKYEEIKQLMQDAPSWPKEGSIRKIDDSLIAVKLSDYE